MEISDKRIDNGNAFDWGRTSGDYARFRDIYPDIFYRKIADRGLCTDGQDVLDLGTGTGVLPRNMYRYGAKWTGTDISPEQIAQAKQLAAAADMDISFLAVSAEDIDFPPDSFDVITACQCFWYFDHKKIAPKLAKLLRKDGRLLVLYMAWLPDEDKIAGLSEKLILSFNPDWSGAGEKRHPIYIPDVVYEHFDMVYHEEYDVKVPFTREKWHGRIRASRGVGASLPPDKLAQWEKQHMDMLTENAPEEFEVLHYAAMAELKRR